MAQARYKIQRGCGTWWAWDGDLLHLPVLLDGGVGGTITSIVGTTNHNLSETAFDNLVTTIRANQATQVAAVCDTLTDNSGLLAEVQALVDALTS